MRNILVVSVNWLGDAVFSTPVYHALKGQYPLARVTALCVPRVREVLAMCPDIDDVMVYDEDGIDRPLIRKCSLVHELRRRQFDAVYILRRSLSRTCLTVLAGIPVRVGFASKGWRKLLTTVTDCSGLDDIHRADVYLRVLESAGVKITDRACRLTPPAGVLRGWRDRLSALGVRAGERIIAVNTGGNWDLKQWPVERFVELVRAIHQQRLGRVILPGASKDVARVQRISDLSGVDPLITAGETGLTCLAGLLGCVDVLITADTGPLHLASAIGTSTIALFGPTRPEITGPRGQGRSVILQKDVGCNKTPCYYLECPDNRCMKAVEVQDVLQALQ
ncbi:MAG: glycosyltransferase family 9 protein [Candidatus Omnitrophica bacterium]|nr:glycosyltransferase family 9 protein [Candidatus Omnitrophota bacterium]